MKKAVPPRQLTVHIHGKCGGRLKKIVTMATEYYLSLMMPKHQLDRLVIDLHMKTKRSMKGDEGTCLVTESTRANKPFMFEVEINRDNNTKTILYSLAHELVHVKQFALGELDENQTRWQGRRVDTDKVDYWDLPWEIDAYGRERGLYVRFIDKYKLDSIDEEFLFV